MRIFRLIPLTVAALCLGGVLEAAPRTWRDVSGRTLEAEFLSADASKVYLKLEGGKVSEVALGLLSNPDLEFVQKWRQAREKEGIVFEAPLTFEIYRSKKFSAAKAQNLGYFPVESGDGEGVLRLEFKRYGKPPTEGVTPVLRLRTASAGNAGTYSTIYVYCRGKVVGHRRGAHRKSQIDIPLKPSVLTGNSTVEFTIKCGRDDVLIQGKNSGQGARLLVFKQKDE